MRTICGVVAALLSVWLAAGEALAQADYPDKPIRIIVGFSPGVAPDVTSRLLGDKFNETWAKGVVVENVTGAGGNIAVERVAKAAPDGYTLLMGGNAVAGHQSQPVRQAAATIRSRTSPTSPRCSSCRTSWWCRPTCRPRPSRS